MLKANVFLRCQNLTTLKPHRFRVQKSQQIFHMFRVVSNRGRKEGRRSRELASFCVSLNQMLRCYSYSHILCGCSVYTGWRLLIENEKNNYCPKSDGGDTWDCRLCETLLGQRASSGSQWAQWEFLYCLPVGTKWEHQPPPSPHTHTLTYSIFTSTLHSIYLLPISNFVFTERCGATAVLGDPDYNLSRPACVDGHW